MLSPTRITDCHGTTRHYDDQMELHNEHGPAIVYSNGDIVYLIHGKIHREDGPAVIDADGTCEYWLGNILYSAHQYSVYLYYKPQYEPK